LPLLPADEAAERAHFEHLERETTQPVRRPIDAAPRNTGPVQPGQPDYVAELSRAMQGAGHVAAPDSEASLVRPNTLAPAPEPQDEVAQSGDRTFQPLPFSVPAPSAFVPVWARRPLVGDAGEPPPQETGDGTANLSPEEPPPEPNHIASSPVEQQGSPPPPVEQQIAEPQEAVPLPPVPQPVAPAAVEPPPADVRHLEPPPPPPPAPPQPPPVVRPAPSFRLEVPPRDDRHEPVFASRVGPAPSLYAPRRDDTLEVATAPRRDWRELVGRAAHVAFLLLAGWFIAVLVLIVAYRFINPPFSMLMAQRWLGGTAINKEWVPLTRISSNLSRAVIVAEDGRFCSHWGVDFIEAANAIRRASDGYPRGASTITMQVAKNLFLVPAKSYLRKMVEIPLTFAIELVWPKRRILEVYLNIVEWGPGVFGAEAASRGHFGRAASSLTARQAAQLAAVLPNPIVRDAGTPGPRTSRKASVIQARAARARGASACVDIRR